jgi:EpsI family protein
MRKPLVSALSIAVAMATTAVASATLKPGKYLHDTRQNRTIDTIIPKQFGQWSEVPTSGGIVNPQNETLTNLLYSEVVNRIYQHASGTRIILTIAYGRNQGEGFQLHTPELCYPAQGFQIKSIAERQLDTSLGSIPVRQLESEFGHARKEPITYWATLGDSTVHGNIDKKVKEMKYSFKGYIADGLLFRISSIDPNSTRAFEQHRTFANDLLTALDPADLPRIAGISRQAP